jgi:hypothetical protein
LSVQNNVIRESRDLAPVVANRLSDVYQLGGLEGGSGVERSEGTRSSCVARGVKSDAVGEAVAKGEVSSITSE